MKKLSRDDFVRRSLEMLEYLDGVCQKNNISYFLHAGTLLGCVRHGGLIPWDDDIDICMPRYAFEKFIQCFENHERFELQYFDIEKGYNLPYAKVRDRDTLRIDSTTGKPLNPEKGLDIDIFIIDGYSNNANIRRMHFYIQNLLFVLFERTSAMKTNSNQSFKSILKTAYRLVFTPELLAKMVNKHASLWDMRKTEYAGCLVGLYRHRMEIAKSSSFSSASAGSFEGRVFPIPCDSEDVLISIYGTDYMTPPPVEKRISTHTSYLVWKP